MEFQASLHSLNGFDYTVIGILLLSGLLALVRGFVREVLSIVALAGAFYVAAHFYLKAEPYLHPYVTNKNMLAVTSGLAVFFAVWIALVLVGFLIARTLVQGRALNVIDRSLGFGFGLVRGLLILSIIYLAITSTLYPDLDKKEPPQEVQLPAPTAPGEQPKQAKEDKDIAPAWLVKAKTRPALAYGANLLKSFIPDHTFEKATTASYIQEKEKAQRAIDDHALEMLSTPAPAAAKPETAPSYDNTSRDNLNNIVNQRAP